VIKYKEISERYKKRGIRDLNSIYTIYCYARDVFERTCVRATHSQAHYRTRDACIHSRQTVMNKLQTLIRTENFILKLSIQFYKNSELSATRYQKNIFFFELHSYIDFSHAQLKPNKSDGTGNEGAATQQYICTHTHTHARARTHTHTHTHTHTVSHFNKWALRITSKKVIFKENDSDKSCCTEGDFHWWPRNCPKWPSSRLFQG